MKKQLLFLTFILLFNLIAKAQAPVIYPVYNTSDLEAALYSAYPNSNPSLMPGDIIQIKSDLDVSSMDLPIIIPSGVIVQGTYDLLSEPNSNGSTYSNANGTTLTSHHKVDFKIHHNDVEKIFVFKLLPGTSLAPTTIRNLKIVGPDWSWIDHNNYKAANAFQSAGIFLDYGNTDGYFNINHCEIFGFSYAGVFGSKGAIHMNFDHNYIHHIKEIVNDVSGGYANWIQSNEIASDIAFENIIFDDCRAAIDGQSGISNWAINNCTMTQFMYGGIAKHNGSFSIMHDGVANCSYYNRNQNPHLTAAGDKFGIYDNAGGNVTMTNNISHFQLAEDYSRGGLCGFPYPYYPPISQINYVAPNCTTNVLSSTPTDAGDLNDGGWINIPIGFSYDYFGTTYQFVNVCTNGFIQFGSNLDFSLPVNTIPLDVDINSSSPNNFIAMCWTDLDFTNQGTISYCTSTINGVNVFEVQWQGGKFVNSTHANTNDITGHIRFFENSPIIEIYIEHINTNSTLIYKTIGIENEIGAGVPYLNYQNYSTGNPFGIRFEIPIKFKVELKNNTMASTGIERPTHYGGYATIADNHIESCIWDSGDDATNISSTDNSFDYLPGQNVGQNCPQPPECTIQLKDQMNVVLPKTNIDTDHSPDGYSYISAGSPINIAVSPGSLGSQTNAFIIQPNPNHGNPLTYNSSANNDFFNDREIIGPATGTQIKANYSYDVARPGLYGIDALAVAATNSTNPLWQEYNSSTWQHIPLIVKPSYDESHLIFNIKDSYYEEYTANGSQPYPETHVLKTAELNGHRIWQEDIAEGGDGWERIDIPMNSINPDWIVPASDENKNLLTFSINFDSQTISTSSVQGVSVWVDDVYINRYSSAKGTNLIADGDIENEGCGKLTTYAALGANPTCSWFKLGNTSPNYPIVCVTTSFAANNSGNDEVLYNDGNPILISQAGSWICDSYLNGRERKSGQTALVLDLPRIDGDGCPYYIVPPLSQVPTTVPIDPLDIYQFYPGVISVYTLFEYPRCGAFADDLEDQFSDLNAASAPPINNSNFNLNHNLRLAAGTTLELNNCVIAIGPEVSITVPATSTLKVNNSTLSACGEDMWKGIILEPGATLKTNTSTFADAEQAIYLHTAGSGLQNIIDAQIENCTFNSNYIGIDMEPTPSQTFNNIKLIVMQSTFNSPYPLKSSKNFNVGAQTYAGINLNDWTGIIGKYASSPNIFENVSFGIRSIRCALTVWSSKFIGIREDHLFVTPNSGTGIYAEGNSPGYILKQYGFGQAFDPSFSECDLGILSNGVASSIVGNNMISMNRGILLSNLAASSTSNVTANTIHCSLEGIISQFPNNIKQLTINADSVFVNNDSGINNYGIGIGSFDASGTAANVSIVGNYVKMENATMGIHTNGAVGNIVANNKINMTDNSVEEAISISAYSGSSNVISCNSAFGNTATQWPNQHGYQISLSTENEISCNNATDIYYGFEFDDDCHMMDKFIGNTMNNHFIGLNFNQDGIIGEQWHRGNSWTGTYLSGNEAVDPNYTASPIYVNQSDGVAFNPVNPDPSGGVWIISNPSGNAFNCSAQKVCGTKEPVGGRNSALEKAIADGSYNPSDFPEESSWMARLFLFQKLMKESGSISDPSLLAFYNSNLNSNLDEINKIRKETERLPSASVSDSTILANNDSLLRQNITMLENATKSFYDGSIAESQYNATSNQLKQIIENASEASRQIEDNIRNQRNQQAETIRTLNSLISTTKHYEENEKFVSDLYLRTVGKRITEVSNSDQSQLLSIAHECPFVGGQAVYKARALYRLVNPLETYEDYALCHSMGLLRKSPIEASQLLESVVFPNPSSSTATLAYSILEDTKTTLEIFDFSLKLVSSDLLNTNARQKELNLENLIQGLYIYNIIQNNHVISKGKFGVIR